jgi:hypothetical protein
MSIAERRPVRHGSADAFLQGCLCRQCQAWGGTSLTDVIYCPFSHGPCQNGCPSSLDRACINGTDDES